jgi:hypothetical protein
VFANGVRATGVRWCCWCYALAATWRKASPGH